MDDTGMNFIVDRFSILHNRFFSFVYVDSLEFLIKFVYTEELKNE